MKKYIKNLSKLSMVVVSAVALFFFSFNTNAQQEPGCEIISVYEHWEDWEINGVPSPICMGIPIDCVIMGIECERQ